jgi:PAS domain S-box-containing protein
MSDKQNLETNAIATSTRKNSSASFEEGMIFQDDRGYIRAVNPAATAILGLSTEQLIGFTSSEPCWQTIHEDGSSFEGETHPATIALATGKPCTSVVMGFYKPNGKLIWLLLNSQPLFQDSQTKPYGVVTTFSDITERKQSPEISNATILEDRLSLELAYNSLENTLEELSVAEEELREQTIQLEEERQRYQDLFNFAPDGYIVTDRNGKIEEANLAIAELLDIQQKYLIGKPLINFIPRQDYQSFHDRLERLNSIEQKQTWEITFQPRNKNSFIAEVTIVGIEKEAEGLTKRSDIKTQSPEKTEIQILPSHDHCIDGGERTYRAGEDLSQQITGWRWLIRNITERKQIERELRLSDRRMASIARLAPVGIFRNNKHGQLIYINDRGCKSIGLSLEECLGEGWMSMLHPKDRDRVIGEWRQAIENNSLFYSECCFQHRDGSVRWAIARAIAEIDEEGQAIGYIGTLTDISTQKQAEESLRQANQRITNIWESMTDAYITLDREWRIIYANQAASGIFQQLINLEPPEFLGRSHWEIFPFAVSTEIEREYRRAVSEQVAVHLEVLYEATEDWFEVHAYPFSEGLGIYFRNISDRKRCQIEQQKAEIALRQSEHRYRTLFETIDEGFCICEMLFDEEGKPNDYRFLKVNPAFERMTGLYKAVGKTAKELIPNLESHWFEIYGRVVLNRESIRFENQSIAMNKWFDVNAFPVDEPQDRKFAIVFNNITERKQAELEIAQQERRYRYIFEAVGISVWEEDFSQVAAAIARLKDSGIEDFPSYFASHPDFVERAIEMVRIIDVNGATIQMCEAESKEQLVSSLSQIFLPETSEVFIEELLTITAGKTFYSGETVIRTLKGKRLNVLLTITFPPASEYYDRVIVTLLDITDRQQAQKERERLLESEKAAREEAEAANRIKDEFMAILSHELRSPLNPILGWTQLLKTYKTDLQKLDQGLDTIDRNAKLLLELIDDLLDVAKILRGKITLNLAPVNLIKAIEGALDTVSTAAKAKSIAISTRLNPVGKINGDFARLQQIFWNLLSNAVKFTHNGGKVEVGVDRVGDEAQITVSDNGKGIAPEFLPHVFEYFRQADGSVTRKHGGLGLGLAIVRHLVELHGGVIAVTSPGTDCGATFIVSLPLITTNSDSNNRDSSLELSTSRSNLAGMKILIVDDDRDNLDFLTMALECDRAFVISASSASETLSLLEEFSPDLLVSDIAMPNMDGLTLIKSIRSRSAETGGNIPAIALSAYARESDRQKAIAAGFQAHVAKPVNISFLTTTILEIFNQPSGI